MSPGQGAGFTPCVGQGAGFSFYSVSAKGTVLCSGWPQGTRRLWGRGRGFPWDGETTSGQHGSVHPRVHLQKEAPLPEMVGKRKTLCTSYLLNFRGKIFYLKTKIKQNKDVPMHKGCHPSEDGPAPCGLRSSLLLNRARREMKRALRSTKGN